MRNLILVRHATPEIEPDQPSRRWHLSETGWAECKTLAEELEAYHPVAIVSSYEAKAQETASIIASHLRTIYRVEEGLHEHERSDVPYIEHEEDFKTAIKWLFKRPNTSVFGDETANQAKARFSKTIESLLEKYPEGDLVVVSHGTVISLYAAPHAGMEPFQLWKQLGTPSFVVLSLPAFKVVRIGGNTK